MQKMTTLARSFLRGFLCRFCGTGQQAGGAAVWWCGGAILMFCTIFGIFSKKVVIYGQPGGTNQNNV